MSQPGYQPFPPIVASLALALCLPACGDDSSKSVASSDAQVNGTGDGGSHGEFPPVYADASVADASVPLLQPTQSALVRAAAPSTDNVSALGASNRGFAFDLYHQLALVSEGQNLLFSPFSISTALAMTYAGATGTTASEMKTALHFDLAQAPLHEAFNATDLALASRGQGLVGADGTPFRVNINNALWSQSNAEYPVVPAFLDTLALNYGAGLFQLDFEHAPEAARGTINEWVSAKTEKLIPELLPQGSIDGLTRFVLTNTVYFNASWQQKFDSNQTRNADFTKLDGSKVTVSMMSNALSIPYAEGDGYRAIALPYASDELRFIAILPSDGQLTALETALSGSWFDAMEAGFSTKRVALSLPKLDYQAKASLKPAMQSLGMKAAFMSGAMGFAGIDADPDLYITDIFHRAVIKVAEDGTIAAAATAVVGGTTSVAPQNEETISFDRPFLIAILDAPTGALLFVGRVLDPTAK